MRAEAARMSSKTNASAPVSVTRMFIHHVQERLAFAEALQVLEKTVQSRLQKSVHAIGRVRRKQHVRQLIERMARRQRFGRENVQRRAANLSRFQRPDQRRLINRRTSPDVDQ